MSRSPERISSYRRHFEDSSSSSYRVRVSSLSPTRRGLRHASANYFCRDGAGSMRLESVGTRAVSALRRSRMVGAGVSAGAMVCVGPSGEPVIDLDMAAAENQVFLNTRTSERQEMIVLNDRLAVYINKVRSLEQQNKLLEAEIEAYQNRFEKPSGLRLLYEEQLRELKKIADQMRVQRDISVAAKESTAAQLEAIKIKYEEAVELKKKAELDIEVLRPDVDQATSSRIALEKKLEQLEVEIEFLKRVHQQEIDELMKQIYAAQVSVESAFTLPDLAAALKQIQTQYDGIAAKNLQEMDSWYKNKFEDLTKKTSRHVDTVRSIRDEIAGAKKDIQTKERDLETMKTRNEALEAQIREMQEKYRKEIEELQAQIEALQLELKSIKEKIALHLREYQDLLNIKMALEIEIITYRKLIEGEDLRLSGMMQTLSLTSCSMSAIGSGMSFSGGGTGGVGGGIMGGSGGGVGGMGSGIGRGGGGVAGSMDASTGSAAGGMSGRMAAGDTDDSKGPVGKEGGPDMIHSHGLGVAVGGVATGSAGAGAGARGMSGVGTGAAGLGAGIVDTGAGAGAAVGRLDTGAGRVVAEDGHNGAITGVRTVSAGGMATGAGLVGTLPGGVGTGPGGVGTVAGGVGAGPGGVGAGPGGVGTGVGGMGTGVGEKLGFGAGIKPNSSMGGVETSVGGGAAESGGAGIGFKEGNGGAAEGKGDGTGRELDGGGGKDQGIGPAVISGGISGSGGIVGVAGDDLDVALSAVGGKGDTSGAGMEPVEYGSDGYDGNIEANAEQAVELTERRTVLIRTIKNEDDVLEVDHKEQTYTITGAADDSDND